MPTPTRRRLRLLRRGMGYGTAVLLVCMALVLGVASQLLPLVERHPEQVAAWLSERAGRPVRFEHVDTRWTRRGPVLQLDGLAIGEGPHAVRIGQAEMLVSMYGGLLPGRAFTELRLRHLALTLLRADDGSWRVQGLPGQQAGTDPFEHLEGLGELQVVDGRLAIRAPSLGWDLEIPDVDLRLQVHGDQIKAGVRARIRPDAPALLASLAFDRRSGSGQAYADLNADDVAGWSPLLRFGGVQLSRGQGRVRVWTQLHRRQVVMLTTDAQLRDLQLVGKPLPEAEAAPRVEFGALDLRARWRLVAGGWRFDAPRLRVRERDSSQQLDGLLLAWGQHRALVAEQVDAGPMLAVLGLSDQLEPGLRRWLVQARPMLRLQDLTLVAERGGPMQGKGRLAALGFQPVGHAPGLQGLAGDFLGDAEGFQLQLDDSAPMRFDWPSGFGVEHEVHLQGRLVGWRDGNGWQLATPDLHVQGKDFGADARGGLWFQEDGSRPWINIAAELDDAPVPVAKGFWIHHSMPAAAIEWLDQALVDGRVHGGRALVSGDLDDWPFAHNNGRFEATAQIQQGNLRFQPEWPALEQVEASLRFLGAGFNLEGSGKLAGVEVQHLQAGIESFGKAELRIDAEARSDAGTLLALLRQSPLHETYGETLDSLGAAGKAQASFHLLQPLHHEDASRKRLQGTVRLSRASLSDKRWDLAFTDVSGSAEYSDQGFVADDLQVNHEGQAGRLSLRAGNGSRDGKHAFEAELQARVEVQDLLDHAPEMDWLRPYAKGESDWTVGVTIGKSIADRPPVTALELHSNLVGTRLSLPAPLEKRASEPLATTVLSSLPMGSGQTDVVFDDLLALRARTVSGQTGVHVRMGGGDLGDLVPAPGLVVTGRTAQLDALDWAGLAGGGGEGETHLPLRHVDVHAQRLLLLGADFPDTRLQLAPAPAQNAVAVTLEGPELAGALMVPGTGSQQPIAGRLSRLYWRRRPANAGVTEEGTAAAPMNPASIPALALDVDDLRMGDAVLGNTRVRTHPLVDGMQIDQLQFRAPKQKIDITGSWRGTGTTEQTAMQAKVESQDFGKLLDGVGYPGQLGGGEGQLDLQLQWPGGPAGFALPALEGKATLSLRDGHLLEIEPGAGRVLGLLSVAEVRRRMTLDFSDFFSKGFAFNHVTGDIRLHDGKAISDNLQVDGPAAEIRIAGTTDLRAERFDQTIEVLPKSANVLTAVGAVAAGPLGAAVGAVANAVLKKPLGQIGAKTYRVTGPWKQPQVDTVSRAQPLLPAPTTPPLVNDGAP